MDGRGWARNVKRIYQKELGGKRCVIKWYTQTLNKEARILSNSSDVSRIIHFPYDWKHRWRDYYQSMKDYQRQGKNEHDDAEDCTTSIVEELTANKELRSA